MAKEVVTESFAATNAEDFLPPYISSRLMVEELASSRGLLQLVEHHGVMTQREVARELGLSAGTCNLHFQKLEHLGLLNRAAELAGRGRSTIQWEIENEKNLCIEIVFDVPFFLGAVTTFGGTILLSEREDLTGLNNVDLLKERVDRFINRAKELAKERSGIIRPVFMGLPGILDPSLQQGGSGGQLSGSEWGGFQGVDEGTARVDL